MTTALALGRARSDIDVISRSGLPLHYFMDEATEIIQRRAALGRRRGHERVVCRDLTPGAARRTPVSRRDQEGAAQAQSS